ncbi:MAG: hypothetical protein AABZ53_10775 [Planctomycetota bacterium]
MIRKPSPKRKSQSHSPDPIVAEVRKVRDAFARRQDYDVDRIITAIHAEIEDKAAAQGTRRSSKKVAKRGRPAA